jgi:hypothetical protein
MRIANAIGFPSVNDVRAELDAALDYAATACGMSRETIDRHVEALRRWDSAPSDPLADLARAFARAAAGPEPLVLTPRELETLDTLAPGWRVYGPRPAVQGVCSVTGIVFNL